MGIVTVAVLFAGLFVKSFGALSRGTGNTDPHNEEKNNDSDDGGKYKHSGMYWKQLVCKQLRPDYGQPVHSRLLLTM